MGRSNTPNLLYATEFGIASSAVWASLVRVRIYLILYSVVHYDISFVLSCGFNTSVVWSFI